MYYAVLVSYVEPPPRRRRHTLAMFIVALLGLPISAGAVGRAIDFLPAVQSASDNARVNVANLKNQEAGVPPGPCRGAIAFYDGAGSLISGHSHPFSLMPGAAVSVVSPFVSATGLPIAQRARITFPAPPRSGLDACGGIGANYEVFETATQQTRFMNPGVIRGFNPQPDPPGMAAEE